MAFQSDDMSPDCIIIYVYTEYPIKRLYFH